MWLSIVPLSFHLQSHLLQLDFNWHIIKYVCHTDVQCSHELMDYAFKLALSIVKGKEAIIMQSSIVPLSFHSQLHL